MSFIRAHLQNSRDNLQKTEFMNIDTFIKFSYKNIHLRETKYVDQKIDLCNAGARIVILYNAPKMIIIFEYRISHIINK